MPKDIPRPLLEWVQKEIQQFGLHILHIMETEIICLRHAYSNPPKFKQQWIIKWCEIHWNFTSTRVLRPKMYAKFFNGDLQPVPWLINFVCLETSKDLLKSNFITKINFEVARQQGTKTTSSLVVTAHWNNSQRTTMEAATTWDNDSLHKTWIE